MKTLCLLCISFFSFSLAAAAVQVGMDYKSVLRELGRPDGEMEVGSKQILTYGTGKIYLRDGKVESIGEGFKEELAQRNVDKADIEAKRKTGMVNYKGEWMTQSQVDSAMERDAKEAKAENIAKTQAQVASSGGWYTNYDQALAAAKADNKKLLLNFTGSDWCGWCIRLDEEVFSQSSFRKYAADNYVLVKLDFPRRTKVSPAEEKQNEALARKFDVRGFPTIIVLNSNGKLHKRGGYVKGGPSAFLASIR